MFSIIYGEISFDTLEKLYREKDYYTLIKHCYYSDSASIHRFLHSHLLDNNIIVNYIYIRRQYLNDFPDFYILEHCLRLAIKTIYICAFKISLCKEFNKSFPILSILSFKFTEKFKKYINKNLLKECLDSVRFTILDEINSSIISISDPTYIYFIERGYQFFPAIYYNKPSDEVYRQKYKSFVNYNDKRQFQDIITQSYILINNKFENILNNYMLNDQFDLTTEF